MHSVLHALLSAPRGLRERGGERERPGPTHAAGVGLGAACYLHGAAPISPAGAAPSGATTPASMSGGGLSAAAPSAASDASIHVTCGGIRVAVDPPTIHRSAAAPVPLHWAPNGAALQLHVLFKGRVYAGSVALSGVGGDVAVESAGTSLGPPPMPPGAAAQVGDSAAALPLVPPPAATPPGSGDRGGALGSAAGSAAGGWPDGPMPLSPEALVRSGRAVCLFRAVARVASAARQRRPWRRPWRRAWQDGPMALSPDALVRSARALFASCKALVRTARAVGFVPELAFLRRRTGDPPAARLAGGRCLFLIKSLRCKATGRLHMVSVACF